MLVMKFKEKNFNDEVKHLYAEKMNERMLDAGYKMTVFDKEGPYFPTKKSERTIRRRSLSDKIMRRDSSGTLQ